MRSSERGHHFPSVEKHPLFRSFGRKSCRASASLGGGSQRLVFEASAVPPRPPSLGELGFFGSFWEDNAAFIHTGPDGKGCRTTFYTAQQGRNSNRAPDKVGISRAPEWGGGTITDHVRGGGGNNGHGGGAAAKRAKGGNGGAG
ncbi:hypothetical protein NADE_004844 [Nannochloris sp. 'desiccata']|nr:hypothetical protein NADE_004844 [Chlorella desiccata (nom. nud.)]